jgi:hypothetical protein
MTFKIGQHNHMAIANIGDISKEAEVKRFDYNSDGILDIKEASDFYAAKTGGKAPRNIDEVFGLVGGRQHDIQSYHQGYYGTIQSYTPNWKGDFNVPGLGAGNVRTGRAEDRLNLLVDCDLMSMHFIENQVEEVNMLIGPKDFAKEANSTLGEAVVVPMNIATQPGTNAWNRGGGHTFIPEKKFLAASIDTEGLRSLGNNGDLSFYFQIKTKDGKTHYINKDGRSFNNFILPRTEIKERGNP